MYIIISWRGMGRVQRTDGGRQAGERVRVIRRLTLGSPETGLEGTQVCQVRKAGNPTKYGDYRSGSGSGVRSGFETGSDQG